MLLSRHKNGAALVVNVCACMIFLHTIHIIYINTKKQRYIPLYMKRKSSGQQIAGFSVND